MGFHDVNASNTFFCAFYSLDMGLIFGRRKIWDISFKMLKRHQTNCTKGIFFGPVLYTLSRGGICVNNHWNRSFSLAIQPFRGWFLELTLTSKWAWKVKPKNSFFLLLCLRPLESFERRGENRPVSLHMLMEFSTVRGQKSPNFRQFELHTKMQKLWHCVWSSYINHTTRIPYQWQ